MKVFCHFAVVGLSNTYVIGPPGGGEAIIIDPSRFDSHLLNMIEDNHFYIKSILVTHNHDNHIRGISVIKKIYDAQIYASSRDVLGFPTHIVEHKQSIELNGIKVEPLCIRGHTSDSLLFKINQYLFTGDILSAGRVGTTSTTWAKANMIKDLEDNVLTLPEETILCPGHGPPSTIKIEKLTNGDLLPDGNYEDYL